MTLIIDISKETYNAVIDDEWIDTEYINNIINSIQNGTPLPKGHGDLIDREEFNQTLENIPISDNDKWFNWLQKTCLRLAEAPTIIEADKGE